MQISGCGQEAGQCSVDSECPSGLVCSRLLGWGSARRYCRIAEGQCPYGGMVGMDGCTCYGGGRCYQVCSGDDDCDPGMVCGGGYCNPFKGRACEDVFRCYDPSDPYNSTCSNLITYQYPDDTGRSEPREPGRGGGGGNRYICNKRCKQGEDQCRECCRTSSCRGLAGRELENCTNRCLESNRDVIPTPTKDPRIFS